MIHTLNAKKDKQIAGYDFYITTINNRKIIISKTLVGTINATIATSIGILHFNPDIVINLGIAGAHTENLHVGDIIIGEKCCNINSYKMPVKKKGEGSNPFEWELNKRAKDIQYGDLMIADIVEKVLSLMNIKQVYRGILGSGDVFNREYDRILWVHKMFNHLCEDMESIGTYSVCNKFKIPVLGIRIISNNELLGEEIHKERAIELQKTIIKILPLL